MRVLVACEESQEVCKAFRALGHEAYSCDIQECSGDHPEWHIWEDVIPLLNGNCVFQTQVGGFHIVNGKWDLIIAHPPCTYLSNAGACRLYPHKGQIDKERYKKGLEGKKFFMQMLNADCEHIAVENPVPSKVFELPEKSQVIQPYEFGHPFTKKTYLWLKGLPQLKPTEIVEPIGPYVCGNSEIWKKQAANGVVWGKEKSAKHRSKTFPGIAKAMAEQWGGISMTDKSVLISIKPQWCELIANGRKTIEVRKTRPKIETPFKCYVYETKAKCATPQFVDEDGNMDFHGSGMVIGEFVCDEIHEWKWEPDASEDAYDGEMAYNILTLIGEQTGMEYDEFVEYGKGKPLYGWHISDLKIYEKAKELSEFHRPCTPACNFSEECGGSNATGCLFGINKAPQSWCYVEELR